jgi:hypothetical protein
MQEIKGTEVDEPAAGQGKAIQEAPGIQGDGTPTPPIKTEPKRQLTLRVPAALYDRIEASRGPGEEMNPRVVALLERGLSADIIKGDIAQASGATTEDAVRQVVALADATFISREEAFEKVNAIMAILIMQTGSRINTDDRPGNLGLRSLVRKALLGD